MCVDGNHFGSFRRNHKVRLNQKWRQFRLPYATGPTDTVELASRECRLWQKYGTSFSVSEKVSVPFSLIIVTEK